MSAGCVTAVKREIAELMLPSPAWQRFLVRLLLSNQGTLGFSACACAEICVSLPQTQAKLCRSADAVNHTSELQCETPPALLLQTG